MCRKKRCFVPSLTAEKGCVDSVVPLCWAGLFAEGLRRKDSDVEQTVPGWRSVKNGACAAFLVGAAFLVAQAARANTAQMSNVTLLGVDQPSLPSLPLLPGLLARALRGSTTPLMGGPMSQLDRFAVTLARQTATDYTSDASWAQLLTRMDASGILKVTILGMSTTAGCGAPWTADEPTEHWCDFQRSWVRHWHERMRQHLQPSTELRLRVEYKNAVGGSYFGHCTHAHVDADSDIIVLEWMANAWDSVILLNETLHAIRRAAPRVSNLFFVHWPPHHLQGQNWKDTAHKLDLLARHHAAISVTIDARDIATLMAVGRASQMHANADGLLELVTSHNLSDACETRLKSRSAELESRSAELKSRSAELKSRRSWATSKCRKVHHLRAKERLGAFFADSTHPNSAGHWLLGTGAAAVLSDRLEVAAARRRRSTPATTPEGASASANERRDEITFNDRGAPISASISAPIPAAISASISASGAPEACLRSAEQLTVRSSSTQWRLVDDGMQKRVPKLGLASTTIGDELRLALPTVVPRGMSCATAVVTLGYLASARDEQGAIEIGCDGCPCGPYGYIASYFRAFPFPILDTHIRTHASLGVGGNVSVSAEYSFVVGQNASSDCSLVLRHRASRLTSRQFRGPRGSRFSSRVRVDSLYVREAQRSDERGLREVPEARAYLQFRDACAASRLVKYSGR